MIGVTKKNVLGKTWSIIKIINNNDMKVVLSNYGAGILDIETKNSAGLVESVVISPKNLEDYYHNNAFFGRTCGRVAGRIDKGRFKINDQEYQVDLNWNNVSCLHGGFNNLAEKLYDYTIDYSNKRAKVIFTTTILEEEDHFPGDLMLKVIYVINMEKDDIYIEYNAYSTKDTLCNITNHTYFNLSGNAKSNVLNHLLQINASKYTNLNNELITKSIDEVNSVMSFKEPKAIGQDINNPSLKNHPAYGYDHAYLLDEHNFDQRVCSLYEPISKRQLSVYTSYDGLVVYTCNYPSKVTIIGDRKVELHDGVCLECQHIPNSINMFESPLDILKANQSYQQKIKLEFRIKD